MMTMAHWTDAVERQAAIVTATSALVAEYGAKAILLGSRPLRLTASSFIGREHLKRKLTHIHTGRSSTQPTPVPHYLQPPPSQHKGSAVMSKVVYSRGRHRSGLRLYGAPRWNGKLFINGTTYEWNQSHGFPQTPPELTVGWPDGWFQTWNRFYQVQANLLALNYNTPVTVTDRQAGYQFLKRATRGGLWRIMGHPDTSVKGPVFYGLQINLFYS